MSDLLQRLPHRGFRVRQPGELVTRGDYLQIGGSYALVDGSVWVGMEIEHGGPFETVWTTEGTQRVES